MVEKLKDAANLLKAKIKQDDLQELLTQVVSEQNWQASTNQLHEVANAAYNYEKWQKINDFIWDKLKKSKSWRKILKSLNLVEFLLKNGPPSIISAFKYDIYQFRSFDNYSHYSDGIDRGEAIREKSKIIVQLLSNQQLLQQQRVKAKNIRQKMAGIGGTSNYGGYGGNTSGMAGSSWGGSKYQSFNNKNVGSVNSSNSGGNYGNLGVYGDYGSHKSTLDKYKDSNAKKPTTNTSTSYTSSNNQSEPIPVAQNKKPFEKIAPKLGKPGSKPAPKGDEPVKPQVQQPTNNQTTGLIDDDIFSLPQTTSSKNQPVQQQAPQNTNLGIDMGQLLGGGSYQSQKTQNNNVIQSQQNTQVNQQPNTQINQQQNYQISQQQNPQMNQYNPNQAQQFGQFGMGQYNPMNMGMQGNMGMYGNIGMQGNTGMYGNMGMQGQYVQPNQMNMNYGVQPNSYQQAAYQKPQQQNNIQISLSSGPQKKEEDEFGGFQSGNKGNVNWLSSTEKNLTDFSDFGAQMKKNNNSNSKSSDNNIKMDNWDW